MKTNFTLLCLLLMSSISVYSQHCYTRFLADSLLYNRQFDEAIRQYKQINPTDPDRRDLYRIAIGFCAKNLPDSAGYYYELALQKGFIPIVSKNMSFDHNLVCLENLSDYHKYIEMADQNKENNYKRIDTMLYKAFMNLREKDQYYRNFVTLDSLKQLSDTIRYIDFLSQGEKNDSLNRAFLDSVIRVYNRWPGYDLLGQQGDNAAWLILQHSDNDIAFQEKCLPLLEDAARTYNTNPHNVAYLYDRIMINKGLQQRYATQMRIMDNKVVFINLEDEANVEYYRRCYDLPPLSVYKQSLEKRYLNKLKHK